MEQRWNIVLVREDGSGGFKVQSGHAITHIVPLREDDLAGYKLLGYGCGPIENACVMGVKHCKNFIMRVVGFTVSEEGIGKTMGDALGPDHRLLAKRPEMRLTFTFYEKKPTSNDELSRQAANASASALVAKKNTTPSWVKEERGKRGTVIMPVSKFPGGKSR